MNKIKIKSNTNIIIFFIILSLSLFLSFFNNNHLEFMLATVSLIIIITIAKLSYFTIFSFLLWFGLLQEYFASISLSLASGRLAWDLRVPIYFHELYLCIICFYLIEIILFALTDVLKSERNIYKFKILDNIYIAYLYSSISLVLTILAYPTLPALNSLLIRDQGFISSSFVIPISMLLLGISIDYLRNSLYIKTMVIINLLWILLHGDRVIVFGFLIYLILKYIYSFNLPDARKVINIKKIFVVLTSVSIILYLGIRIQYTRMGIYYDYSFESLLSSLVKQGTAADVVHGFNCATDMWKNGEKLNGYTYLYYLSNFMPKAKINYNPAYILMVRYNTLGGGIFFTEPMMNGGLLSCYIYSLIFIFILVLLFRKISKYRAFLVIVFYVLIFRFAWYASLAGLVKMFIYYVPVLYFITKKINQILQKNKAKFKV